MNFKVEKSINCTFENRRKSFFINKSNNSFFLKFFVESHHLSSPFLLKAQVIDVPLKYFVIFFSETKKLFMIF